MSEGTLAQVLAGDATWCLVDGDNAETLGSLVDSSVDATITDPPYESAAHTLQRRIKRNDGDDHDNRWGGGRTDAMRVSPLSFSPIADSERQWVAGQFGRTTKRWIVAFCQVEAAMKWSDALAPAVTKRIGVWVKPDAMPQFSGDRPGMGYESIVFAHRKGRSKWNGGGKVGVFVHNKNSGGAHEHETQKPLPLMLELVSLFTDPGDLVLDAFAGSGTTGVACLRLGRRFIGIEKDQKYAAIARERLRAGQDGLSLRDVRAGQLPMFGAS